ncbi:lactate permease [Bacillus mycoides]|uniref:YjcQ protein n=1 Tax=Bacillus cereus VD021 TaxID=1053224 RepID=R8H2G0_BACCE|nr:MULTISPECIES: hypothetical protein [Bacillus cereus group]AIW83122.1 yjcQ family protein [Bacillus mycoides]EOO67040.1 hypothetical protein IIC_05301 [Bacillus cereus VD021]MCQ6569192.1 lactate permease [Bacillus mycoides]GAE39978.1 hypothetical protein BW1_022_00610 [Bacillus mycoides NBRC 101238 = DSM 11821]HDR7595141.1 lactate permease [Bacillus mycoides]
MKLINLSEKLLRHMVTVHKKQGVDIFTFEQLKVLHPNETDDFISKAIYTLKNDGFVTVFIAEGRPQRIVLLPNGIINCEENTLLKRGYKTLKEIKSWIS